MARLISSALNSEFCSPGRPTSALASAPGHLPGSSSERHILTVGPAARDAPRRPADAINTSAQPLGDLSTKAPRGNVGPARGQQVESHEFRRGGERQRGAPPPEEGHQLQRFQGATRGWPRWTTGGSLGRDSAQARTASPEASAATCQCPAGKAAGAAPRGAVVRRRSRPRQRPSAGEERDRSTPAHRQQPAVRAGPRPHSR